MSKLKESVISSLSRCRLAEASLKNAYFRREDNREREFEEKSFFLSFSFNSNHVNPVILSKVKYAIR